MMMDYHRARAVSSPNDAVAMAAIVFVFFVIGLGYSLYNCPRQLTKEQMKDQERYEGLTAFFCDFSGVLRALLMTYFIIIIILHLTAQSKMKSFNAKIKNKADTSQLTKEEQDELESAQKLQKYAHYASIPLYIVLVIVAIVILFALFTSVPWYAR